MSVKPFQGPPMHGENAIAGRVDPPASIVPFHTPLVPGSEQPDGECHHLTIGFVPELSSFDRTYQGDGAAILDVRLSLQCADCGGGVTIEQFVIMSRTSK